MTSPADSDNNGSLSLSRPTIAAGIGYVAIGVTFILLGGLQGGIAASGTILIGLLTSPLLAFLVGHVLLLLILPSFPLVSLVIVETGLGVLLVAAAVEGSSQSRQATTTGVIFLALSGILISASTIIEALVWRTFLLLSILAVCAYGIHRYELVQLNLVTEGEP